MKNNILITLLFFLLFLGCKSQEIHTKHEISKIKNTNIPIREYSIQSVLWQQNSGEYRALTHQAFNLAKLRLDYILTNKSNYKKPIAIVADIDETLLNNSPYSGKQIQLDEDYSTFRWTEWVQKKKAKAIPGALDFFNYAKSKNVAIFYISNRSVNQKKETIQNLKNVGFPFADANHVFLKEDKSGKEPRRFLVKKSHEIVLLFGDNLSDFSIIFDKKSTEERNKNVDSLKLLFGKKFIILPNPMYGDWEVNGILEKNHNWSNYQKDSIRHQKIKSY
jgi:5'-nucleotidase (lipoprotein e(P4) family)